MQDVTANTRFSLLDLDIPVDVEVSPDIPVIPARRPSPEEVVRSRRSFDEEACHASLVVEQHRDIADGLSLQGVAEQVAGVIRAEDRREVDLVVAEHDLDAGGLLVRRDGGSVDGADGLEILPVAYSDLSSRAPSDALVRQNLRSWMGESKSTIRMRTMNHGGRRAAFCGVTSRYVTMDVDVVADMLARALPADTTANFKYDGDGGRWQITATITRPWDVPVGDSSEPHQARFVLRGRDDGAGALETRFAVLRRRCTNGLTMSRTRCTATIPHRGDHEVIVARLAEAFHGIDQAMQTYAEQWAHAHGSLWRGADGEELDGLEALRRMVANGILPTGGRRRHSVWGGYREAFEAEPGDTVAHVVSAVTRWAHEGAVTPDGRWRPSSWAQEDAEEAAEGVFQYAHVLLQPVPEEVGGLFA